MISDVGRIIQTLTFGEYLSIFFAFDHSTWDLYKNLDLQQQVFCKLYSLKNILHIRSENMMQFQITLGISVSCEYNSILYKK